MVNHPKKDKVTYMNYIKEVEKMENTEQVPSNKEIQDPTLFKQDVEAIEKESDSTPSLESKKMKEEVSNTPSEKDNFKEELEKKDKPEKNSFHPDFRPREIHSRTVDFIFSPVRPRFTEPIVSPQDVTKKASATINIIFFLNIFRNFFFF